MCFAAQHHGQQLLQYDHSLHLSTNTSFLESCFFVFISSLFGLIIQFSQAIFCKYHFDY